LIEPEAAATLVGVRRWRGLIVIRAHRRVWKYTTDEISTCIK